LPPILFPTSDAEQGNASFRSQTRAERILIAALLPQSNFANRQTATLSKTLQRVASAIILSGQLREKRNLKRDGLLKGSGEIPGWEGC
jgi:hypothetical protein